MIRFAYRNHRRTKLLLCSAVVAPLIWSSAAHSQALPAPAAGKPIQATLSLGATYDGNVARGTNALASARGLVNSETYYTPTAGVVVALPLGREMLSINATAGYDFHEKNKNLESERIGVTGAIDGRVGQCSVGVGAGYSRHQSDLVDVTLLVGKNLEQSSSESIHESCPTPIGIVESLSFASSQIRNSGAPSALQQQLLDSNSNSINGSLGMRAGPIGLVSLTSSFGRIDYVNRSTSVLNAADASGVETYTVGLNVDRPIGARLRGAAGVGFVHIRPLGVSPALQALGAAKQSTNHSENVQLTYLATSRMTLTLAYLRSVEPSYRADAAYQISQNLSLSGSYRLSPRLSVNAGASLRQMDLPSAAASLALGPTSDKGTNFFAGGVMSIGRQSSLSLNYQHSQRNTNLKEFDYSGDTVSLLAATRF